ncbi:NUDIX hydrolase [Streptomyces virginiae]|uniref:NUDIX hydrolase n=1 Tax=Streptomyces virginiae TaxID=1961 RepID=UPI003695D0EE
MTDTDIHVLEPLRDLINQIVRSTPIGATDQLAADLTVHTAVWVGKNVLPNTPGLAPFVADVDAERSRQLAKFGDQRHTDGTGGEHYEALAGVHRRTCERAAQHPELGQRWALVLLEEVYEALAESDPARLRAELIQIAAVCAAWVSDLDRRDPTAT